MNKKELENEIMKTQKQLKALQEKLKEAENEVPETLEFADDDEYCYVDETGNICWTSYTPISEFDADLIHNHRAFLEERLAETFADKTQFIADLLHVKGLYDKDYKPNWNNFHEEKWIVYFDNNNNKYYCKPCHSLCDPVNVYFSTKEIAQKCADWLNKRNKE